MKTKKIAFCGIVTALGLVLMLAGGILPFVAYALPLFASLLLIMVLREYGTGSAWSVYIATALLSLFLCADKEAAFFYIFPGSYPILRIYLEKISAQKLKKICKFIVWVLLVAVMDLILILLFGVEAVFEGLGGGVSAAGKMALVSNAVISLMMVYIMRCIDVLADRLGILYERRLRPVIRKML